MLGQAPRTVALLRVRGFAQETEIVTQQQLDEALDSHVDNMPYQDDCQQIVDFAAMLGLRLLFGDARRIWSWWSDRVAAGWLRIVDEDEIRRAIEAYVEEYGDGDE